MLYVNKGAAGRGDKLQGSPPQFPSLQSLTGRTAGQLSTVIRQGIGRMPAFPNIRPADLDSLVEFLLSGESKEGINRTEATGPKYPFTGYHKFLELDGYPAVEHPCGTR